MIQTWCKELNSVGSKMLFFLLNPWLHLSLYVFGQLLGIKCQTTTSCEGNSFSQNSGYVDTPAESTSFIHEDKFLSECVAEPEVDVVLGEASPLINLLHKG